MKSFSWDTHKNFPFSLVRGYKALTVPHYILKNYFNLEAKPKVEKNPFLRLRRVEHCSLKQRQRKKR